jgi:hypothetical protein
MKYVYTKPKCKFGKNDRVVDATYVTCTEGPTPIEGKEAKHSARVITFECLTLSSFIASLMFAM